MTAPERDASAVAVGIVIAALLVLGLVLLPWINRESMAVIWAGTLIAGDPNVWGAPGELTGIEIGLRGDGMVIWRRRP